MKKSDPELEMKWGKLLSQVKVIFGKRPQGLNAMLYLIGVQELGMGVKDFTKENKQDLMHIAVCKVLSYSGFYELEGRDEEGWPHWKLVKQLPHFDLLEQENLLKTHVIEYFEKEFK